MNRNVGGIDRIVRFFAGPLLLLVGLAGYDGLVQVAVGPVSQALGSLVLVILGVVFTATAATQHCPLYRLFGFNTCPVEN